MASGNDGVAHMRLSRRRKARFERLKIEIRSAEKAEQKAFNLNMDRIERRAAKAKAITAFSSMREGGFRREVQPRRQHWFLNEKSGFPFRTPAFCSVSRGQRRLGEKEYRAPSVTPGVALRPELRERT